MLESVDISFTSLRDESLRVIATMPIIERVGCVGVPFTDAARDRIMYSREPFIDFQQ
jgi:hypothetical protein